MSSVSDILQLEALNNNLIYLHKEGLFWKAYQRSTYQFLQHYGTYKVIKKYVKAVKQEVVSLGFPDGVFQKLFSDLPEAQLGKINEKQVYVCCQSLDEEAYAAWFASVPLKLFEATVPETRLKELRLYDRGVDDTIVCNEKLVMEELRAFRLELATPMSCMNFVDKLKQMI